MTERRVSWPERATYLSVLVALKRAVDHECDAVQVGAAETVRFGALLSEAQSAREKYQWRVHQMSQHHQKTSPSPMPPDPSPPRQRRS